MSDRPYPVGKKEYKQFAESLGVEIESDTPESGELYIAGRNTDPKLLTCSRVTDGFVVPEENEYCFNVWECFRLIDEYQ